jgi:hypothetical protein
MLRKELENAKVLESGRFISCLQGLPFPGEIPPMLLIPTSWRFSLYFHHETSAFKTNHFRMKMKRWESLHQLEWLEEEIANCTACCAILSPQGCLGSPEASLSSTSSSPLCKFLPTHLLHCPSSGDPSFFSKPDGKSRGVETSAGSQPTPGFLGFGQGKSTGHVAFLTWLQGSGCQSH